MRILSYAVVVFTMTAMFPLLPTSAGDLKLEPGFKLLFNGKNLDGWREKKVTTKDKANAVFKKFGDDIALDKLADEIEKVEGAAALDGKTEAYKGRFKVVDGILAYDPKVGGDRYIETAKEFGKDVHVKFDFKPGLKCNNDILFRGVKFDIILADPKNKETKNVKEGEWCTFDLIVKGNTIEHKINGETARTTKTKAKATPLMLRGVRHHRDQKHPCEGVTRESKIMGEIRVTVTLINSADEMAHRRRKLKESTIRRFEADAVVDTGAVRSVIPIHVMEKLGVMARGQRMAEYADGRKEAVGITEPIIFDILGRDTLEEALVLGDEVLIGHTIVAKLDLRADCANRKLIPNPAHPDQPVSKVK